MLFAARFCWLLLLAVGLSAQPPNLVKTRKSTPSGDQDRRTRHHVVIRFLGPVPVGVVGQLREAGVRIVQFLPPSSYVAVVPGGISFDHLDQATIEAVRPADKLSLLLNLADDQASTPAYALVEFYPDVDMNDARSLVLQAGLQIQENPDLLDHHLLVYGDPGLISGVADWDEVAYVFPAADELVQGIPMNGCSGALSAQGQIGQSVAKVGGWPGGAQSGADLKYAFSNVTDKVPAGSAQSEIARAFTEWSKYVKVTFSPSSDTLGDQTITILFGSGFHGDPYPFDGPGGVLAHTFYPYPINPEPIAGDMHFDADENWQVGADTDLFSVALHETGHALGLGHSDRPGAVMYPYYRRSSGLTQEDISAIQTLYPAQDGSAPTQPNPTPLTLTIRNPVSSTTASTMALSGAVTGGSGAITASWSTGQGASGIASGSTSWTIPSIPLSLGANAITVSAVDASQAKVTQTLSVTRQQVAATPPVLNISSPVASGAYNTTSATITLTGSASDATGIQSVSWNTSKNRSGQAIGTSNWTAGPIALDTGSQTVTITASAQSGTNQSQSLQVVYTPPVQPPPSPPPPAAPPPGNDNTPPTMAIVSPATTYVTTNNSTIVFSGNAKDNAGVASVTWSTSNGDSGTATGTTNWSATIPLLVGSNTVTITAKDPSGNSAWRAVTVARH